MTFLSYAQNFEDVLLWRALGHIKNGFYIDVGANDPVEHSVTKAFYDAGWWGINVEPMPSYVQVFLRDRPRDVNLAIAAGATDGSITLYDTPAVNGWASVDPDVAAAHRAQGTDVVETTVAMRTLASICAEHARGDIHFLKVDVEGWEGDVLRGMDFQRWRPWVVLVEAIRPNSQESDHEDWEHLLTQHRYTFAYFDGLNRYYVAEEHPELLPALSVQANVFDAFISRHLHDAWQNCDSALKAAQQADAARGTLEQRLEALQSQIGPALEAFEKLRQADERKLEAERYSYHMEKSANDARQRMLEAVAEADALRAQLLEAQAEAASAKEECAQAQAERQGASVWGHSLERQLIEIRSSWLWRGTAPLRFVARLRPRAALRGLVRKVAVKAASNERVRRIALKALARFPALESKVKSRVSAVINPPAPALSTVRVAEVPPHLMNLSGTARTVLADLQRLRAATTVAK
ncbi:hypothetical protein GCM10027277_19360 [Pseudoduganella ginsengisoli]|uniref:FkbM family methyltransferase n=1 Tax=Pseudoduganella ginsengisoli TaxID=1462440 RepID=A0A6L6PTN8_9BURK|nr:FkbM family methyltransferase [Pseudoduganella ginsengisoli]MTW00807.1 FkbM family methyltransferase [Pseudoduganella ginsengisoli]